MKKKILVILTVMSIVMSMSTVTFAHSGRRMSSTNTHHSRVATNTIPAMCDADGNFLSLEDYTKKLDDAIKAGTMTKEDKEIYLERYNTLCNGTGVSRNRSNSGCGNCAVITY